jgi:hypothetical protein
MCDDIATSHATPANQRLLLPGRERLSRRGISYLSDCGGFGTPRSRSASR